MQNFCNKKYQVQIVLQQADGKTLNYLCITIIKMKCRWFVFAAIYFDEIKDISNGKGQQQQNFILFGSENQIMNFKVMKLHMESI
ncbi:MAG: hypothetical protein ACLS8D_00600 [Clostridioides difficile]